MDRKTILVVEDNRDELMIYTTLLSYRGFAILAATDFDSALDIARSQAPDLAVIDINLNDPERDGCDLIGALQQDDRTRGIPVIGHTAFGDVYRHALERAGCSHVLHKPASPHDLVGMIEDILGRQEATGESGEGRGVEP